MAIVRLEENGNRGSRGIVKNAIAGLALAFFGIVTMSSLPAQAEERGIEIELNRLQDVQGACRISLVFTNRLKRRIEALSIETVLFDRQGAVERFLVLKSNALPAGKVRVQQFDAKGTACDGIGRILLNDVKDCKTGNLSPADCLALIRPSSRTGVSFFSNAAPIDKKDKPQ